VIRIQGAPPAMPLARAFRHRASIPPLRIRHAVFPDFDHSVAPCEALASNAPTVSLAHITSVSRLGTRAS